MSTDVARSDVLIVGPKGNLTQELSNILEGYQPYNLVQYTSIDQLLNPSDDTINPLLIVAGAHKNAAPTNEWVQTAKMIYPHVPVIVLHDKTSSLDFKTVLKNGARHIMHITYDREFISDRILQLAPVEMHGDKIPLSALVAIHATDFEAGTKIEFNLYVHLPTSKKTILFRRAGTNLDDKAISKIRASSGQRVYVKKTDLKSFYAYARAVLKQRGEKDVVSLTERQQNAKAEIQNIMAYFLDDTDLGYDHGREILRLCEVILVELDIMGSPTPMELFRKIIAHNGQEETIYNNCINLCVYSASFAKALKLQPVEVKAIALSGLLHNIGLAGLPEGLLVKPKSQWTTDDREAYERYPLNSVLMIKTKKVPLEQEVAKGIEQHREFLDGSGFPNKHKGTQIGRLSRIVSIAQRYQSLTSLHDDRPAYSPLQAFDIIVKEMTTGDMKYDGTLLQRLHSFIKSQTDTLLANRKAS